MTDGTLQRADERRPWHVSTGRRTVAVVVGLYLVLTLAFTYPLSVRPADTVLDDGPDMHLFLWTIAWDTHALTSDPLHVFDANIYHPKRYTLAYSENLLGSALFAAPVVWLTGNYVLALNLVLIASTLLCAVGAFVLARRVGCSVAASVVAGLVFGFAPSRFTRISQAHLAAIQWVPFTLAYLHGYFETGRARDLRLAIAFAVLQVMASGHGAAFLVVGLACVLLYRVVLGEPLAPLQRLKDGGFTLIAGVAIVAFVAWPYHRVQVDEGLRRTLENWVVPAESYLASPSHLHQWVLSLLGWQRAVNERATAYLFPGFVPLLLVAVTVSSALRECIRRAATGVRDAAAISVHVRPAGKRADAANVDVSDRWWRAAAACLTIGACVAGGVALWVAIVGPIRTGRGQLLSVSVRDVWRPTMMALVAAAARALLGSRVPHALSGRGRRPVSLAGPDGGASRLLAVLRAFAAGVVARDRSRSANVRDSVRAWVTRARASGVAPMALVTVVGTLIAVGPPLSLWPYVYWLPGFNFVRVPSRFMLVAVLGGAVLAARGLDRAMSRRDAPPRAWLAVAAGAAMVVESFAAPLAVQPYTIERPAADAWLAGQPRPYAVAEVPLTDPGNAGRWERTETTYMLHSLAHFAPTVHGYSGYRAAFHEELFRALVHFPDDESLRLLRAAGVSYVVVHPGRYPENAWPETDARLQARRDDLQLVHEAPDGRVYRVR